jgi:hypothetical protein
VIILGACKLRRQTYFMQRRQAIFEKSTTNRATPRRRLRAPSPRINCDADELLRSHETTCNWGEHEARARDTRPALRTFRLEDKLSTVRKPLPLLTLYRC